MASNDEQADILCPTCGQRYDIYYARPFTSECETALDAVRKTLVQHHGEDLTAAAHPRQAFNVPSWNGQAHMSAAALLSNAPVRRMVSEARSEHLAS